MKLPLLRTGGAPLDFIEWGTSFVRRSFTVIRMFLTMMDACVAEVCENYGVERRKNMDYPDAEQRASEICAQYPEMFPIDPFTIARNKNIEIRYFIESEGKVVSVISNVDYESPTIIALKSTESVYNQRFSVAYNLGHYQRLRDLDKMSDFGFIEFKGQSLDIGNNLDVEDDSKIYAYRFAMELLMPKHLIIAWNELKIDFDVVRYALNVSNDALRMRYKSLGLNTDGK